MSDSQHKDAMDVVVLSNGTTVGIKMPRTGEVLDLMSAGKTPIEVFVTTATSLSFEEFRDLPFVDGAKIMTKLEAVFEGAKTLTAQVALKKLN